VSPSKGTARRTVRIPDELWEAAQEAAEERGESVSDIIRRALEDYIREP
jgi:predicted transcriptional regulator